MNDISIVIRSEKDTYSAIKDNGLNERSESKGAEFLSQLYNAHDSFEPTKKSDSETNSENTVGASAKNKFESSEISDEISSEDVLDNDLLLSGDSMLAQISSAQNIDTSIKKHIDKDAETINLEVNKPNEKQTNTIDLSDFSKVTHEAADKEQPLTKTMTQSILSIDSEEVNSNVTATQMKSESDLSKTDLQKSRIAQAVDKQLSSVSTNELDEKIVFSTNATNESKAIASQPMSADSSVLVKADTERLESTKTLLVDTLLSKDVSAIKLDKVLSSLTPEQLGKLNAQIHTMDKPTNTDNVATLKQMLAQYITENEQSQSAPSQIEPAKNTFSNEINGLTVNEKQSLLTQLSSYIKSTELQGDELASLKQTINELKASIASGFPQAIKAEHATTADNTLNVITPSQKDSSKLTIDNVASGSSKDVVSVLKDEELIKQSEPLLKESLRNSTEQLTSRTAQLFTQITNALNVQQTSAMSSYDTLGYEQSVVDMQILQSQALQNTNQVKQVSIDPGVMEAINIIKSDAAKLLQERVSSMLSINNKEAEIRLDPPEMGSMQIRIRSDAEQAQINFVVQNQQAKEALEQSLPRLREMLAQQGIDLGESTISYGGSGSEGSEHNEGDSKSAFANKNAVIDENNDTKGGELQGSHQQTSSSIDYYA
jgi:flagellar hook-length control protein FliK